MNEIGFLLLTYSRPASIARLVRRLQRSFPNAPIVCHHDFGQCPLLRNELPGVKFVWPYLPTSWNGFDTIEAVFLALKTMIELPNSPEWTVVLSGADFPIKPASEILRVLANSPFDGYMHHEPVDPSNIRRPWQLVCVGRYFRPPLAGEVGHPFSERRCFAGEGWSTLRRIAVKRLVERHQENGEVTRWFRRCEIPGEAYFQTILLNERDIAIHGDPLRFIEWRENAAHPNTLTMEHWPRLMSSHAHFARKFDPLVDAEIIDRLDEWLDATDVPHNR